MNLRPTTFVMPSHKRRPDGLPRIVLLDADVFFAPRMRDLFMHLREQELIHLHWTRPNFPQHAFKGTQVTRYSMSAYLDLLYEEDPETVLKVVEVSGKKLKTPKLSRPEYVAVLVKNGCVGLAAELARLWRVPCPVFR